MAKRVFECAYCGQPSISYKDAAKYCSCPCSELARRKGGFSASQWRYMVNLAGNRNLLSYKINTSRRIIYRDFPVNHVDTLLSGGVVNIGGILAKRCSGCEVTKEVSKFHANNSASHGIASKCAKCS